MRRLGGQKGFRETVDADHYIVATSKPWNVNEYHKRTPSWTGRWHLVERRDDLKRDLISEPRPRYIFFPHWSWKVPKDILDTAECVCFHMTDLPYGRGGSPLQNLIARGCKETMVSALRMVPELDAGPVYFKKKLSLSGNAQDIFERLSVMVFDMIEVIIRTNPSPKPQEGEPTYFARRQECQSVLPEEGSLETLYNHIRMLDADTYPRAFVEHGNVRLEFHDADLDEDVGLTARVKISLQRRSRE